jgi:hypothetical protein
LKKVFLAALVCAIGVLGTLGVAVADPNGPQGQGADKVTVCHETGSDENPYVTLDVSANGAAAHERKGDDTGSCPPADPGDGGGGDHPSAPHLFSGLRSSDASTVATVLASTR